MLAAIWMARRINEELGGAFVGPWDVNELPQEWIDAIIGIRTTVPKMMEGKALVEAAVEKWRKKISVRQ